MTKKEKNQSSIENILDKTISSLKKHYNDIDRLGISNYEVTKYYIDSGNYALNYLCSWFDKGLPIGRIIEAGGVSSSGKTAILLTVLARIQEMGGIAIIDDVEHHYDKLFGSILGINNNLLVRTTSKTVKETFTKMKSLVEELRERGFEGPIAFMLDSLGDLTTEHEQKIGFDKRDLTKAYEIKKAMRLHDDFIVNNDILYILCNHVYDNVGVLFGEKQRSSGGHGIEFSSSIKLRLSRGKLIKDEKNKVIGNEIHIVCKKNKIAPNEGKRCTIEIYHESGIDKYSGLLDILLQEGKLEKEGRSFLIPNTELKFNKKQFPEFIEENKKMLFLKEL